MLQISQPLQNAKGHFNQIALGLSFISAVTVFPQSAQADTFNYTAGATCVARSAAHEQNIVRTPNSLLNRSSTAYVQVFCSGPAVEFPQDANARFIVYAKQGDTTRFFKAAFRLFKPDDGALLSQEVVRAASTPNADVKFGSTGALTDPHCCAYNQVQIWIPPRSTLYNVYSVYEDSRPTEYKAYVWANNASSASYVPSATYSYNSTGGTNRITRSGAGTYRVSLPGVGGLRVGGNVQVSAYGFIGGSCRVNEWNGRPTVAVDVTCTNPDGDPTDMRFTLLFTDIE